MQTVDAVMMFINEYRAWIFSTMDIVLLVLLVRETTDFFTGLIDEIKDLL